MGGGAGGVYTPAFCYDGHGGIKDVGVRLSQETLVVLWIGGVGVIGVWWSWDDGEMEGEAWPLYTVLNIVSCTIRHVASGWPGCNRNVMRSG